MRLIINVILAFTMLISFSAQAEKIKIGVSLPLTGPASTYGLDIKNILEFSNSRIGNKYELIFEDDKCSAKDAALIANKFASELKIKYSTGYACSSALLAAAPAYEKAKVLTVALISTAKSVTEAGDYIFRTYPSNQITSAAIAEEIFSKYSLLGVVSEQTEYAQTFLSGIQQVADKKSAIVENVDFQAQDPDIRSLLLKLRLKKVQALYINPQSESSFITVLQQLRKMNWNVPVFSAFFAASPVVLKNYADLAKDITVLDMPSPDSQECPKCAQIYREFNDHMGGMQSMESVFISSYEGFMALDAAIESATNGKDPKGFLYSTKFDGLAGPWSFDKNGDVQGFKFVIKVIKDGKALITNGK